MYVVLSFEAEGLAESEEEHDAGPGISFKVAVEKEKKVKWNPEQEWGDNRATA